MAERDPDGLGPTRHPDDLLLRAFWLDFKRGVRRMLRLFGRRGE